LPRLRKGEEPSPPASHPGIAASSSQTSAIPQTGQRHEAIQAAERAGRRPAFRRRVTSAGEYGES
jgi:hypothetical protein